MMSEADRKNFFVGTCDYFFSNNLLTTQLLDFKR